jgi:4-amino-4-deoxy-L-arabinose transferase-like glycosyltransferase
MKLAAKSPTLLIVLLCVIVRLGVYFAFPSVFAFEKTGVIQGFDAYDIYGKNLIETGVFGLKPGVPDADFPPLYGYALAAIYRIFGRGSLQVVLFNTALDSLAIILLVQIGRRMLPHGEKVGLLAGLFYALYPYLIFQSLTVIDTPIFTALIYAFIFLMVLLSERGDRKGYLLAAAGGVMLGLTALDRPIVFALAIAIAAWFLLRLGLRQTIRRLSLVAVVSILVIVPWNVRNYQVFNAAVNIATTAGMNFWFGNSQYTIPFFRAGFHTHWVGLAQPPEGLDHRQADAWMFDQAMSYLRAHPEKIPELTWVKFLAYWSIDIFPKRNPINQTVSVAQDPISVTTNAQGAIEVAPLPENDPVVAYSQPLFDRIGRIAHILYFGSLFLLALVGIALTRRHWRTVSLLWFIQISMTVAYVFLSGPTTRYRVPTDPLLFLFSSYTLVMLWDYLRAFGLRRNEPTLAVSEK